MTSVYAPAKSLALRLAMLRAARIVLGGAVAAGLLAVLAFLDGLAASIGPGDLSGESLAVVILVTVLTAGVNGLAKYLRTIGVWTDKSPL